jgi:PAS domain S-box-containing protein
VQRWFRLTAVALPLGGALVVHDDITAGFVAERCARIELTVARVVEGPPAEALGRLLDGLAEDVGATVARWWTAHGDGWSVAVVRPDLGPAERTAQVPSGLAGLARARSVVWFPDTGVEGRFVGVDPRLARGAVLVPASDRAVLELWFPTRTVPNPDLAAALRSGVQRFAEWERSAAVSARASRLLEHLPDGVVVADRAGTIVDVNHRVEQLLGWCRHALVGSPVERLLPEPLAGLGHLRAPGQKAPVVADHLHAGQRAFHRRPDGREADPG